MENRNSPEQGQRSKSSLGFGVILIIIGAVMILRQFSFGLPNWLFSWPMILIAVGVFIGFSTRFKDIAWLILIGLGLIFLLNNIFDSGPVRNFIWPGFFLLVGLLVVLNQRSKRSSTSEAPPAVKSIDSVMFSDKETHSNASMIEVASVFAGVKQRVVSKDFKGGEIVAVFGGADINLTQTDIQHPIEIEITAICGGVKLIIPPNWRINNESTVIFGGIDDKRPPVPETDDYKIVTIEGLCLFGGIEIRSF